VSNVQGQGRTRERAPFGRRSSKIEAVRGLLIAAVLICRVAQAEQPKTISLGDQCSMVLRSGYVECTVILDGDGTEPKPHPTGRQWDFWFKDDGKIREIIAQNRTMFAKATPLEVGRDGCKASAYKSSRVRVDHLPAGTHLCVRTSSGQCAELLLNVEVLRDTKPRKSNDDLRFRYTLWD
jgi:hypothetical protein